MGKSIHTHTHSNLYCCFRICPINRLAPAGRGNQNSYQLTLRILLLIIINLLLLLISLLADRRPHPTGVAGPVTTRAKIFVVGRAVQLCIIFVCPAGRRVIIPEFALEYPNNSIRISVVRLEIAFCRFENTTTRCPNRDRTRGCTSTIFPEIVKYSSQNFTNRTLKTFICIYCSII